MSCLDNKTSTILSILLILSSSCYSFEFPKFDFPTFPSNNNDNLGSSAALQPGDTVAVVGASGNVGKLVALRLSDTYRVNGIVRDASSVSPFFEGRDNINLYESDLLGQDESLRPALQDANAIVICTGTTAFPTKAWSRNEDKEVTQDVWGALLESKFNIREAVSKLDTLGLNTPYNVDTLGNQLILRAWNSYAQNQKKKRAILLSSIGVQRRDQMPFPILNTCGVLDAKAAAEAELIQTAAENDYSYTIVRPGQLFGGPYDNNYYLGTLFQLDKDAATQDVQVGLGDELLGDTLRSTLAEVTAQLCEADCGRDTDFAVVNVKGSTPSVEELQTRLQGLSTK